MAALALQGPIIPFGSNELNDIEQPIFTCNKVITGLFISGIHEASDSLCLKNLGITHILCLTEFIKVKIPGITYLHLPVMDTETQDMIAIFDETFEFIDQARLSSGNVLVHCMAGISRSATVVTAYLMRKFGFSMGDSLEMVQKARPIVCPNGMFRFQLQLYEDMGYKVSGSSKAHRLYRQKVRRSPRTSPNSSCESFNISTGSETSCTPNNSIALQNSAIKISSEFSPPCISPLRLTVGPVPSSAYVGRSVCVTQ